MSFILPTSTEWNIYTVEVVLEIHHNRFAYSSICVIFLLFSQILKRVRNSINRCIGDLKEKFLTRIEEYGTQV